MAFDFKDIIVFMQDSGFYDYLLPFLLVFAIVFAVLEKTKIFGEDKTNINGVVAFVIGFLLIAQPTIVEAINSFLPRVSLLLIVILMVLISVALIAGKESTGFKGGLMALSGIAIVIYIIYLAISSFPGYDGLPGVGDLGVGWGVIIFVIILIVAWYLIAHKKKDPAEKDGLRRLAKAFGGDE